MRSSVFYNVGSNFLINRLQKRKRFSIRLYFFWVCYAVSPTFVRWFFFVGKEKPFKFEENIALRVANYEVNPVY